MTEKQPKEWSSKDNLPGGFVAWLKEIIHEKEIYHKRGFRSIANELGVNPSTLSRWIAGMGPLTQQDIHILAKNLSPVVYSFLGLARPVFNETPPEEIIEQDQRSPFP